MLFCAKLFSSSTVTVSPDLPDLSHFLALILSLTCNIISLPFPVLLPLFPLGYLPWTKITVRVLESFAVMYKLKSS